MRFITFVLVVAVLILPRSAIAASSSWDRAMQLYQSGNYSGALSELNRLSSSSSSNPSVHYLLGMCYKNLGKPDQAKRELSWVANYATDSTTKEMAHDALGQLGTSTRSGTISGAVGRSGGGSPPAKILINDSVSQTINAAAKSGWRPCPGRCLNVSSPGWHHQHIEGHSDSENWYTFPGNDVHHSFTTAHWGEVFDTGADAPVSKGACPTCGGTGWVRSN